MAHGRLLVLGVAAAAALLVGSRRLAEGPAPPRARSPLEEEIRGGLAPFAAELEAAALMHGLDPDLLRALVWQESKGDPLAVRFEPRLNDSSYGLGQVLLQTARELGFAGGVRDLLDPHTNLDLAARYLRSRFDTFGDFRLSVAAYNSGTPLLGPDGSLVNEGYVQDVTLFFDALQGRG